MEKRGDVNRAYTPAVDEERLAGLRVPGEKASVFIPGRQLGKTGSRIRLSAGPQGLDPELPSLIDAAETAADAAESEIRVRRRGG